MSDSNGTDKTRDAAGRPTGDAKALKATDGRPGTGRDQQAADAAAAGAQAARTAAKGSGSGAAPAAPQAASGWGRARKKLAEAGSTVGSSVGEKVGEVRKNIAQNTSADEVPAGEMVPGTARGTAPRPTTKAATAGAAAAVGSGAAAATGQGITRRTRKARLRLARLDPWSVFKTVLLFSVAGGIIFFVATWVVWGVINASGVFASVNKAVNDLVASPGSDNTFRLEDYVNTHRVLGFVALISVLDAILFTALATLFSFLYNLAATVMGGLEVTLAED